MFKVGIMLERPYIFDIVNYRPYKHISPEQGTYTTIEMLSGISSGSNHISFFGHCRLLKQVLKCLIRFNNWCFPEKAMVTIELPVKFNELRLTWTLPPHFSSRFLHPKECFGAFYIQRHPLLASLNSNVLLLKHYLFLHGLGRWL